MGGGASRARARYRAKTAAQEQTTVSQTGSSSSQPSNPGSFGRRLKNFLGKGEELNEFKPHVEFLRLIASPATQLDAYLSMIIAEVVRTLDADRCSLYFVDEIREEVFCVASTLCEPFRLPWDRGIVGQSARDGKLLNLHDVHSHWAFDNRIEKSTGYTVNTMLALPIKHMVDERRSIGVIQVLNKKGGPFTHHDENELAKIAMIISDSFYRQRWRAFETGAMNDREALSVIAECGNNDNQQIRKSLMLDAPKDEEAAVARFVWRAHPPAWVSVDESERAERQSLGDEYETPVTSFSMPAPMKPFSSDAMSHVRKLRTLEFDALACSPDELVHIVLLVMEDTGVLPRCHVDPGQLRNWAWAARRLYRDVNPYHNWFHAVNTYHGCYHQIIVSSLANKMRCLDVFGLLVSALCHDIDHPGYTNGFLVQEESELAIRYNDTSVLENHHAHVACELLRKDECAIGSGLRKTDQQALRRIMIKSILDTDMINHRDMCHQAMTMAATAQDVGKEGDSDLALQDRQFWLSLCLHSSDLSAQCLPWSTAAEWESRISQEFLMQADQEIARGLTPAPFMQFNFDDLRQRSKLQLNFIDFVLLPMWDPYSQLVPQLRPFVDNLLANRAMYDHRASHGFDPRFTPTVATEV